MIFEYTNAPTQFDTASTQFAVADTCFSAVSGESFFSSLGPEWLLRSVGGKTDEGPEEVCCFLGFIKGQCPFVSWKRIVKNAAMTKIQ